MAHSGFIDDVDEKKVKTSWSIVKMLRQQIIYNTHANGKVSLENGNSIFLFFHSYKQKLSKDKFFFDFK